MASALVEMGAPGSVHIGDWACPYGHFNTRLKRECARCVNEDRRVSATERYKVAMDEPGKRELMDFVQRKELEQNFSRPTSTELEREQAVSEAQRPDEEVIEAREAESDRGFPAPFNQDLTAEEQAEFYKYVLEAKAAGSGRGPRCRPCCL